MGQQQSLQGANSKTKPTSSYNQYKNSNSQSQSSKQLIKHQNILRVSKTPFENCEKIEINNETYFLETTRNNLKQLITNKQRQKKSFPESEVMKLIQNMVYTLAYLQSLGIAYPCLIAENIFQCQSSYKLLPPNYLSETTYQKLFQHRQPASTSADANFPHEYIPASPEMLIALRCREPEIAEKQILYKSNVFALGLLLLEFCTLKESKDCYDTFNMEILDQVINERLSQIQEKYSNRVVRIVANMIDYDFQERMDPKELAIWVNREVNETQQHKQHKQHKYIKQTPSFPKLELQNAEMIKSRLIEMEQPPAQTQEQAQEHFIKSRMKLQIPVTQYRVENATSKRITEIRTKIIKDKIKAEQELVEDNNLTKSRRSLTYIKNAKNKQRERQKYLPNPYMNPSHIPQLNHSAQPSHSPQPMVRLSPAVNRPKVLNSRYLYTQTYEEDPIMTSDGERNDRNASPSYYQNAGYSNYAHQGHLPNHVSSAANLNKFNLKYKYNCEEDDKQSARQSSNRKRDSQRFVRVEKYLAQYQKAGCKKEFDFLDKSPSKRLLPQHSASISDFSFEPQRQYTQKKLLRNYNQQPEDLKTLAKKSGNQKSQPQFQQILQDYNKNLEQGQNEQKRQTKISLTGQALHPYERHQQLLFGEQKKATKTTKIPQKVQKQNEDIKMIKKQIERSRRIIQEVRRAENQVLE